MPTPLEIAVKFQSLDVHDDTVEGFTFVPPAMHRTSPKVEVVLFRHWAGTRRLVTFTGCANYEVALDADILKDNAPNNTCSVEASVDSTEIEMLVQRQKEFWNVSYARSLDPMPKKLSGLDKLVLFRLRLFGGHLVVVARSFATKRLTLPSRGLPSAASHVKR
jgi:hypothetical protein